MEWFLELCVEWLYGLRSVRFIIYTVYLYGLSPVLVLSCLDYRKSCLIFIVVIVVLCVLVG